ncbi:hypothetical protein MK489_20045 [Myxococcota bacterium]|nr:hypothetical protein [Myxococcota bacterium]
MTRLRIEQPILVLLMAVTSCYWAFLWIEPRPTTLEDFSVLLAADTFSNGRLANPPPALPTYFERPYQLVQPKYVSIATPLPALVALAGNALGDPGRASILTFALACVSVWWMLSAIRGISAGYSFLGSMVLTTHPNLLIDWGIGYTGASLGMLGAALVYGATFRLRKAPHSAHAWVLGLGAAILWLSWPYEGLLACVPAAWILLRDGIRPPSAGANKLTLNKLLPTLLLLLATVTFTGYFNWRTTEDPLQSPRSLYNETYASVPDLLFMERPPAKDYPNISLEILYSKDTRFTKPYTDRQDLVGFLGGLAEKAKLYGNFLLPFPLLLLLLGLPWCMRDPDVRFACASLLLFGAGLAAQTFERTEFLGPFVPLGLVVLLASTARIGSFRAGPVPLGLIVITGLIAWSWNAMLDRYDDHSIELQLRPTYEKNYLEDIALSNPGSHLALAHYAQGHHVEYDWTRNDADIDGARMVWALDLGEDANREIANHFPDHTLWLLHSGVNGVRFIPHPDTAKIRQTVPPEASDENVPGRTP